MSGQSGIPHPYRRPGQRGLTWILQDARRRAPAIFRGAGRGAPTTPAGSSVATLTRATAILVAVMTVLVGLLTTPAPPEGWRFALVIGVVAGAHLMRQRFRVGATVFYLTWGDCSLVIALYLVPAGWVPLAVATGFLTSVAVRWLAAGHAPSAMIAETIAILTAGAGAGAAIFAAVVGGGADQFGPRVAGGLLLAAVGYLAVLTVGFGAVVGLIRQVPMIMVQLRWLRHKLPMFVGNVTVGMTVVTVAEAEPLLLLVLPVVLWLLHRTYAYQVRASERRRMWSALATATRALNQPDEEAVAAAGVRGAVEVFSVGRAEVVLGPDRRTWAGDTSGAVLRLPGPPEGDPVVVPLVAGAAEIGQLRVHFPAAAGPNNGDQAALDAYADALAATLHNTANQEELQQLLARSAQEAQHDPLTGLLNRAALLARAETLVQLAPEAASVALLLVDVDHFREINDTLGHAAGDEVLRVTAQRLRAATRPDELLGWLGGDEFALLAIGSGEAVRADAMRRGQELVALLAEEARIRGVPVTIEASVGVVVAPAGTADMTELLRRAAAATREAKHNGGGVGGYDVSDDAGSSDRPALLAELHRALDRDDELVVVLQPVIDLGSGNPTEVEALVRWRHPRRGLLPPAEFVRAVENSDLLGAFTEYILDRALAAAARWAKQAPPVPVAVNLSARSLRDPRLPEAVSALLRKHRVPGRRLVLEVTETAVASQLPGIDEALTSLRALGVRLAVDDFGTGHASLTFLTRMPLDEVKVDGSFIARMADSPEAAAIVRATVELGRDLGIRVVAEGVETAAQRQQLTLLGCPAGQGFHLARPTSVDRISETLRQLSAAATRGQVVPLGRSSAAAS